MDASHPPAISEEPDRSKLVEGFVAIAEVSPDDATAYLEAHDWNFVVPFLSIMHSLTFFANSLHCRHSSKQLAPSAGFRQHKAPLPMTTQQLHPQRTLPKKK